jgi:hypothetical protein
MELNLINYDKITRTEESILRDMNDEEGFCIRDLKKEYDKNIVDRLFKKLNDQKLVRFIRTDKKDKRVRVYKLNIMGNQIIQLDKYRSLVVKTPKSPLFFL